MQISATTSNHCNIAVIYNSGRVTFNQKTWKAYSGNAALTDVNQ